MWRVIGSIPIRDVSLSYSRDMVNITTFSCFSLFQEKYLLPSPDFNRDKSFPLPVPSETPGIKDDDQWVSGSAELLSGLTDDNRKLVGYMVPWDPWIYQKLFNPVIGGAKARECFISSTHYSGIPI